MYQNVVEAVLSEDQGSTRNNEDNKYRRLLPEIIHGISSQPSRGYGTHLLCMQHTKRENHTPRPALHRVYQLQ